MAGSRKITFVNRREPPLEAGKYRITVTQSVKGPGIADAFTSERQFFVRGERFAFEAGEVVAVFPPQGSTGNYAYVLPHVVLARHTLPWERSLCKSAEHAPWLAILTFDEAKAPAVQPLRVESLLPRSASNPRGLPDGVVSYGIVGLDLGLGEQPSDPCQVIDIPVGEFASVAPTAGDLAWLAHVRGVPAESKADAGDAAEMERSVVVGHRLPPREGDAVAHLVSLEGLGDYLPGGPRRLPDTAHFVRLVTLRRWTFTSHKKPRSFRTYFTDMSRGPLARPYTGASEGNKGRQTVASAFAMGYTAFDHRTRAGDRTASWYRGPLLPYESGAIVPPPGPNRTIVCADDAVRYDPSIGMMDVSYAAAWEIGRLLALASETFAPALVAWKRAAKTRIEQAVNAAIVAPRFKTLAMRVRGKASSTGGIDALAGLLSSLAPKSPLSMPAMPLERVTEAAPALLPRRASFTLASHLSAEDLSRINADATVPTAVATWLRQLARLSGVPFANLVPDGTMLPPESIRFFVLDHNWVSALLQGACSPGRASTADRTLDDALASRLYEAAEVPGVVTGFLLRSAAVEAWPGLEVTAYDSADNGVRNRIGAPPAVSTIAEYPGSRFTSIEVARGHGARFPDPPFALTIVRTGEILRCTDIEGDVLAVTRGEQPHRANEGDVVVLRHPRLRFERIGPSLLLFMTEGVIAQVQIHEPGEGLHFGLDQEGTRKRLRYALRGEDGGKYHDPGDEIPSSGSDVTYRDGVDARAVDVAALAKTMNGEPRVRNQANTFTAAEFALQLVEGAESVVFTIGRGA